MFRIIQPNTWYADPHGTPCKIIRATLEVIHYNRNDRTCIASMANSGRWKDGISWDALQEIKNAVGYADRDAVEIYPAQKDVVNVANMRHLWIVNEPLNFAWRKD
ncbi:DUF4222 domain-containing protein [Citrobacter freundii]|uniref:DUF7694 domain-containing protein n=1 Tax=Citrobacter freundii TaxID=546 RepID=UPI003ED8A944